MSLSLTKQRFVALLMLIILFAQGALAQALPPAETRPANTQYQPAFEGQTRAPGIRTQQPYEVNILSQDLDSPWAVTALPDGRLIITEKRGTLRLFDLGTGLSAPIAGITGVADAGQGGLLDIAPAPDFMTSRLIYVSLALSVEGGSLTALGRGRLSADETRVEDFQILWQGGPAFAGSGHFGSRIAIDSEGYVFVSTGDRQSMETRRQVQALSNAYGKIVRLDQDGQPAEGNPFARTDGALPEIWSRGHRNVQGLAIHPVSQALWASEMGPRGGDELNLIRESLINSRFPVVSW